MTPLIRYLSKKFLLIWLGVVFGFIVLIGLLDSLANSGDIMANDGTFIDTFRYIALRAPVIFDRIFVFTLMVAILLVYVTLIRNHELVAILGFGISAPKQVLCLVPVVGLTALASITFIDLVMPQTVRALQAWNIGEYRMKTVSDENPLWFEDKNSIVRVASRPRMNMLADIEVYKRDEMGQIVDALWADVAIHDGQDWRLDGIQILPIEGADGAPRMPLRQTETQIWDTNQTPEKIAKLAAVPRDLSLSDMRAFREQGNSGANPRFAYGFWHAHRLTRPIAVLILLMWAVAIMQRTGRQDSGDGALLMGFAAGFLFLILDGAVTTFALSGAISVLSAIFIPLISFALIGIYLLIRTESLESDRFLANGT